MGYDDYVKKTTAPQDGALAFVKSRGVWNEPIQAIGKSDEEGEAEPEELEEPTTQQEEAEQEQTESTDDQTATGRPKRKATTADAAPNKRPKITQSKRTRQDDDDPNTPDKRIKKHNIKTTAGYLSTLWKDIQN